MSKNLFPKPPTNPNTKETPMINRNHQTAVFVLVDDVNAERASRLVGSLNRAGDGAGSTIKADIYSVGNCGELYVGLNFDTDGTPALTGVTDLQALAKELGYALAVVVA
jgi:hypothetical protein